MVVMINHFVYFYRNPYNLFQKGKVDDDDEDDVDDDDDYKSSVGFTK